MRGKEERTWKDGMRSERRRKEERDKVNEQHMHTHAQPPPPPPPTHTHLCLGGFYSTTLCKRVKLKWRQRRDKWTIRGPQYTHGPGSNLDILLKPDLLISVIYGLITHVNTLSCYLLRLTNTQCSCSHTYPEYSPEIIQWVWIFLEFFLPAPIVKT